MYVFNLCNQGRESDSLWTDGVGGRAHPVLVSSSHTDRPKRTTMVLVDRHTQRAIHPSTHPRLPYSYLPCQWIWWTLSSWRRWPTSRVDGVEERRQWRKAAHLAHITEGGQAFMNIGKCYGAKVMPIIIVVVVGSDWIYCCLSAGWKGIERSLVVNSLKPTGLLESNELGRQVKVELSTGWSSSRYVTWDRSKLYELRRW